MSNPPIPVASRSASPDLLAIFAGIVATRRSVRAFLPDEVPVDTIERIFAIAGQAPSNCNAQPWVAHVVTGPALHRVRTALIEAAEIGEIDPDIPLTNRYVDQYKTRRISAAVTLFEATGVGRDDKAARHRSYMRNYELFDAPHAVFLYMSRNFGLREAADVGMYAQTLMLALTAHGLGSCAQGAISHYGGVLRRELGVPDDLMCLFGISFGYPDENHPSAAARTDRAPLTDMMILHDR